MYIAVPNSIDLGHAIVLPSKTGSPLAVNPKSLSPGFLPVDSKPSV
jgi:hypothetical protein